jgi:hypothetical protein
MGVWLWRLGYAHRWEATSKKRNGILDVTKKGGIQQISMEPKSWANLAGYTKKVHATNIKLK